MISPFDLFVALKRIYTRDFFPCENELGFETDDLNNTFKYSNITELTIVPKLYRILIQIFTHK